MNTARRFAVQQLVHWAAAGVMVPVLTLVLRELGLTLFEVGAAMATYSLTTVLLEVPSGALADLWGRKRTYLLSVGFDLLSVLFFLSFSHLGMVLLAAALKGAGRAFSSGSLEALAVETIRREQPDFDLQAFFSRVGMAVPAGLAATSLLGGFLPEFAALPALGWIAGRSPAEAFSVNLLVHALLLGLAGLLAWSFFEEGAEAVEPEAGETGDAGGPAAVLRQIAASFGFALRSRELLLLLSAMFSIGLVLHAVETFWQPRLNAIVVAENVRIFGVLGSAYFAVAVLGNGLSPALVRVLRGNRAGAILLYRILSGAALVALAGQVTTGGFAAAYLGFFFLFAVTTPIQSAMLNERVPDSRRATLISAGSLVMQGGGFLGSLAFGAVSQSFGIGTSWVIAGGIFVLSSLLYLPLSRSRDVASAVEVS